MMLIEHTENGSLEAEVRATLKGGPVLTIICKLAGQETCRRMYPASMRAEARAAATHYVMSGYCPCCPGSITDAYFWKQYHARKEGGAA